MPSKTPIAFFSYNRPGHTERGLAALSHCMRLAECEINLYLDAPRVPEHAPAVDATGRVLEKWAGQLGATLIRRPANLGLARSIGSVVSALCESHGRVIVIEDDLIVHSRFVDYMLQALDHYEHNPEVMQVAGCTLSGPNLASGDVFLLPVTSTWGWATWKRSWERFSWNLDDLQAARSDAQWLDVFNLGGVCDFSSMLNDRLAGKNDSWGILWWYAVSRARGLVAYPSQTLVWNDGFDGSGVHCGESGFFGALPEDFDVVLPDAFSFPEGLHSQRAHLEILKNFFKEKTGASVLPQPSQALMLRLWSRLKNGLKDIHVR